MQIQIENIIFDTYNAREPESRGQLKICFASGACKGNIFVSTRFISYYFHICLLLLLVLTLFSLYWLDKSIIIFGTIHDNILPKMKNPEKKTSHIGADF